MGPELSRRGLLKGGLGLGVGAAGAGTLGALLEACGGGGQAPSRALTPTFYQWIFDTHPYVQVFNRKYGQSHKLDAKPAPVSGFGAQKFIAEAKDKTSSWDLYVGMTPFIDTVDLAEAGVIEPWDDFIEKDVLDDIIPSIRAECTYKGKLYCWPFMTDITTLGWNSEQVGKAGLDPSTSPKTWDDLIAAARKVKQSGAAPFGVTFDAHGWRSLCPITFSFDTNVTTSDGLFDFTSPAAVEALQVMKRMKELANPDVLNPGTSDGGVNGTPDEGAFTARQVAYFVKYQNAPIRMSAKWPDPTQVAIGPLPSGGTGATVFWDTGSALFTYGGNKKAAAQYLKALTTDVGFWKESCAVGKNQAGQLPPFQSFWKKWKTDPPEWLPKWAPLVNDQLAHSHAIHPSKWGLQQFVTGQPYWQKYLTGEESDPKKAMKDTMAAVRAEIKKNS